MATDWAELTKSAAPLSVPRRVKPIWMYDLNEILNVECHTECLTSGGPSRPKDQRTSMDGFQLGPFFVPRLARALRGAFLLFSADFDPPPREAPGPQK